MTKKLQSEGLRLSNEKSNLITKESLQTALIYLMNKKDFDKITITEIVNCAGVSRMAFYRNYKSKEDIFNKLKEEVLDSLRMAFVKIKNCHGSYQVYYDIFFKLKEQANIIKLLLKANFTTAFMLEDILFFDDMIKASDKVTYYNIISCVGATLTVATRWFIEGMHESIEFMAEYCAKNIGVYSK